MITEDYVNLEIAKLLKEKGFDEKCSCCYRKKLVDSKIINEEELFMSASLMLTNSELEDKSYRNIVYCSAPTLQMAMKWLREVHNLCLEPYRTACGYLCDVARVPSGSEIYQQEYEGDDAASGNFTTYEKSCEAAIKYCLEKLI